MYKKLLSASIATAVSLAGALPAAFAQEECEDVLVQSRFALANCMIESAVAIAAAAATENGCQEGQWAIETVVPEYILQTIPVQGTTRIIGAGADVELSGQSSAQEQNNVNCRVATTASGNVFDGKALTYSPGFNNFYIDAVIDRDNSLLCISHSVSSGDIELGEEDFDETNSLTFTNDVEDGVPIIRADGEIIISSSPGQGGGGGGQGGPEPEQLSAWVVEEEVLIPDLNMTAPDGFELEAYTDEIGTGCKVEVEASVQNLEFPIIDEVSGGLTISGILKVEVEGSE